MQRKINRQIKMIGAQPKSLPTQFAVQIALSCDLFVGSKEEHIFQEKWYELREKLASFQKMALSTDFETCLFAYYGMELKEHQIEKLKLIHKYTKEWVIGHLVENLMGGIENNLVSGRDKAAMGELISDLVKPENDINNKNRRKSILVKLAKL